MEHSLQKRWKTAHPRWARGVQLDICTHLEISMLEPDSAFAIPRNKASGSIINIAPTSGVQWQSLGQR